MGCRKTEKKFVTVKGSKHLAITYKQHRHFLNDSLNISQDILSFFKYIVCQKYLFNK